MWKCSVSRLFPYCYIQKCLPPGLGSYCYTGDLTCTVRIYQRAMFLSIFFFCITVETSFLLLILPWLKLFVPYHLHISWQSFVFRFCSVVGAIKFKNHSKSIHFTSLKVAFVLLNLFSSFISVSILILKENNECVYLRGWNDDKSQDIWKNVNTVFFIIIKNDYRVMEKSG